MQTTHIFNFRLIQTFLSQTPNLVVYTSEITFSQL